MNRDPHDVLLELGFDSRWDHQLKFASDPSSSGPSLFARSEPEGRVAKIRESGVSFWVIGIGDPEGQEGV